MAPPPLWPIGSCCCKRQSTTQRSDGAVLVICSTALRRAIMSGTAPPCKVRLLLHPASPTALRAVKRHLRSCRMTHRRICDFADCAAQLCRICICWPGIVLPGQVLVIRSRGLGRPAGRSSVSAPDPACHPQAVWRLPRQERTSKRYMFPLPFPLPGRACFLALISRRLAQNTPNNIVIDETMQPSLFETQA